MECPVRWVDAFTDRPFGGNPAAICHCEAAPDDALMQALAAEFGLSETAFVVPSGDDWSLRWFTPTAEVDLCGHATLAAAHALREWGLVATGATVRFHTRSGVLGALLEGDLIELDFPASAPSAVVLPDVLGALEGQVVGAWRGGFLLLELADEAAVRAFVPDLDALGRLPDHAVVVTAPADDPALDYVLRMFGPKVGIDEDPVTGSAQCTAGPFWADRWGRTVLEAAQVSARGGRLRVTVDGGRVRIAGRAVTVLHGTVHVT
jgi:PhzF family phenazine biosynthesis protein